MLYLLPTTEGAGILFPLWLPPRYPCRSGGRACFARGLSWRHKLKKSSQSAPCHPIWTLWSPVFLPGDLFACPLGMPLFLSHSVLPQFPYSNNVYKLHCRFIKKKKPHTTHHMVEKNQLLNPDLPNPGQALHPCFQSNLSSRVRLQRCHQPFSGARKWWQRSWWGLPSSSPSLLCLNSSQSVQASVLLPLATYISIKLFVL